MIEIDKTLDKKSLFEFRENTLKAKKMGKLEKQIDKFLQESGVKYHRQFPVRIGNKHRKPKRYAVSFWVQGKDFILDIFSEGADMSLYELGRHIDILHHPWAKIKMIAPIREDMKWKDVKRDLQMLMAMP